MSGMNYRCFSPRPRSWHPADEEWGTGALSFVLPFLSRVSLLFLFLGRRVKGSLQRATLARTADGKTGQCSSS